MMKMEACDACEGQGRVRSYAYHGGTYHEFVRGAGG